MYAMKGGEKKGIYYEEEKRDIRCWGGQIDIYHLCKDDRHKVFSRVASSFNGKSLALVLVWLVYDMSKGLKNVYYDIVRRS